MKTKDDDDAASAKRWRELKLERVRQRHDILEDQGETSIDIAENDVSIHTLSKETSTKANSAVRFLFCFLMVDSHSSCSTTTCKS